MMEEDNTKQDKMAAGAAGGWVGGFPCRVWSRRQDLIGWVSQGLQELILS